MNFEQHLGSTISTCAQCGRLLSAQVLLRDAAVWFHKHCPEHGPQDVRICSDPAYYLRLPRYHRAGSAPMTFATSADRGCPQSCGLCPQHEQHVCMPILEITDYCDMACPVCLVKTPGTYRLSPAQVERIVDRLLESEGQIDVLNLSGGEPTTHPELIAIVDACLTRKQILYLSVSTNGRRLARDESLLKSLIDRRVIISLQFDGTDPACGQPLRGMNLVDERMQLVQRVGELGGRMSLTVTAARGINDQSLEGPLRLLFAYDHILSVMYQPAAYVGTGAGMHRPEDALTIPDVIAGLDGACDGRVKAADFLPLPCSHPGCFALAYYLRTGRGDFMPIRRLLDADRYLDLLQNRALPATDPASFSLIQDAMYELWSGPAGLAPDSQKALSAVRQLLDAINCGPNCRCSAIAAAERSIKSIFIHHFMDRHTFDLSRARKCCQVYPLADGRLMPACVYNCLRR